MKAISWLYRKLTQNEFKAITDQIQSDGGGSQTYIDLPKGKISDDNLISFFGAGEPYGKGLKWDISIHSLGLSLPPQIITVSQRRDSSNCIREQNKDKRVNIWKTEYSGFPNTIYDESNNPIYIFIIKTYDESYYAGWFYVNDYKEEWFLIKDLCYPFVGESTGYVEFDKPIDIDITLFKWPFKGISSNTLDNSREFKETSQKIFFGAPGVGKSHNLKQEYENEDDVIRITFHPETDYASFIGCYKPVKSMPDVSIIPADELIDRARNAKTVAEQVSFIFDNAESIFPAVEEKQLKSVNKLIVDFFGWNNETYFKSILTSLSEERKANTGGDISYEFCPQAFVNAYVRAWKNPDAPVYLIIEEINRGNCAQIFGDIFQLLDRDDDGYSSYKITPDNDLKQYLRVEFSKSEIKNIEIRDGIKMQLPPNFHILATMNTSDQSLFPIDSAFKRRWEWVYMPIETKPQKENGETIQRIIEVDGNLYDWGTFLENVNERIFNITQSEDKQLGFWFVKPKNCKETISANDFVSKVIFYLWNDIYKDYGEDATSIFNFSIDGNPESKDKTKHSFKQFTPHFKRIDTELVKAFLRNLGLSSIKPNQKSEAPIQT